MQFDHSKSIRFKYTRNLCSTKMTPILYTFSFYLVFHKLFCHGSSIVCGWGGHNKELVTLKPVNGTAHPQHSDTRVRLALYQLHLVTHSFDKSVLNECL